MKPDRLTHVVLVSGAMLLFPVLGLTQEIYFLTDLGPVENTTAEVRINNRGQVLVHHQSTATGLVFDSGNRYELTAVLGLRYFDAFDINDEGVIVGRTYYEATDDWRAVALIKSNPSDPFGTNLVELAVLSKGVTPQFAALSINNDNQAAICCLPDGSALVKSVPAGTTQTLPKDLTPLRIGDGGAIAGRALVGVPNPVGSEAAVLLPPLLRLGTLIVNDPPAGSAAFDIKSVDGKLVAVGTSVTADRFGHAFRWSGATGMVDLDVQPHPDREGTTEARALNRRGEIVGIVDPLFSHACLFRDGQVINLNFPFRGGILIRGAFGWTLQTADSINDYGQIAGWANTSVSNVRAFILTPVRLTVQQRGNRLRISWPASLTDFTLETSTDLNQSNSWLPVADPIAIEGNLRSVSQDPAGSARYFRLRGS